MHFGFASASHALAPAQLPACLALAPKSGVTAVHLAQAAAVSGEMQAVYVAELMKALGVTAIPDKLSFIRQLARQAPPA